MSRSIKTLFSILLLLTSSQAFANEAVKAYFKEANEVIQGLTASAPDQKKIDDLNSSVKDLESLIEAVYYDQTVPERTVTTMMNIKNMIRTAGEIELDRNQRIDSKSCEKTVARIRLAGSVSDGYSEAAMSYQEKELIKSISSLCK